MCPIIVIGAFIISGVWIGGSIYLITIGNGWGIVGIILYILTFGWAIKKGK
jgi:hypothetical protein